MYKQAKYTTIPLAIIGALALMSGSLAMAGSVTLTNTFVTGQPATAASVNSKFAETGTAINDNDGRITTNTGNISTNTTNITAQTSSIGTNTSNIGINTTLIGSNTTLINANMTAIVENADQIGTNTSDIDGVYSDILTNADAISDNDLDILGLTNSVIDHETRITNLENAPGGAPSSADNPIINVDCETESLQAAIETAPLHGKTNIVISGACVDDIYLRRGGITIQGNPADGADSITGNNSGFSSSPLDNYNFPTTNGALVSKTLSAAFEMTQRPRVVLRNLTINAGSNKTAVKAEQNSSLKLINVTLNGGMDGVGLHASSSDITIVGSTVTGNGTGAESPFAGAAVLAEANTVMQIEGNNTFTGGTGDLTGFVALSNTTLRLSGANNVFNAGSAFGDGDEPVAFELGLNSNLAQLSPGAGNQINGDFDVSTGSHVFLSSIAINSIFFEIYDSSSVILEPSAPGTIVVNVSDFLEIGNGSTLDMGDDSLPVTINGPCGDGCFATMRLLDHSSLLMWNGSQVNMNVELHRGSSVDAGNDSDIGGDLGVHGFSVYTSTGQPSFDTSVGGFIDCGNGNGEANVEDASFGWHDYCLGPPLT